MVDAMGYFGKAELFLDEQVQRNRELEDRIRDFRSVIRRNPFGTIGMSAVEAERSLNRFQSIATGGPFDQEMRMRAYKWEDQVTQYADVLGHDIAHDFKSNRVSHSVIRKSLVYAHSHVVSTCIPPDPKKTTATAIRCMNGRFSRQVISCPKTSPTVLRDMPVQQEEIIHPLTGKAVRVAVPQKQVNPTDIYAATGNAPLVGEHIYTVRLDDNQPVVEITLAGVVAYISERETKNQPEGHYVVYLKPSSGAARNLRVIAKMRTARVRYEADAFPRELRDESTKSESTLVIWVTE